ncbi:Ig-like domain-containing protein [Stieleria varia]|uniref:Uncharacterized protein n=1 Tax=Stieleria varia TaxID=2528005 RepID=A0A5C6B347_9BACT|nr:cadherin-like domain-containing protein [Stieleria varia]TWU04894.1 hypothetical protein Pla52n_29390 [Stieleria varia]
MSRPRFVRGRGRGRGPIRRKLRYEALSPRLLLAGDVQNPGNSLDVNNDLYVSALDALDVINRLGRLRESASYFYDVNDDGRVSALDALNIVNSLAGKVPEITLRLLRDTDNDPGAQLNDRRTFDLGLRGRVNFDSDNRTLYVFADNRWVDVSYAVQPNGFFELADWEIRDAVGQLSSGVNNLRFSTRSNGAHDRDIDIQILSAPPAPTLSHSVLDEDGIARLDLLGATFDADTPRDNLVLQILQQPASGTLVMESGVYYYRPHQDFHGSDQFVYEVHDGDQGSGHVTFSLTVNPVNDPPSLSVIDDVHVNVLETSIAVPFSATDIDGDALEFLGYASIRNPLAEIRDTYGLVDAGESYFNLTGLDEKWLFGKQGTSFFLLPNGDLVQWNESFVETEKRETLVTRLDASVYEDLSLLWNAAAELLAPAAVHVQGDGITIVPDPGLAGEISVTVFVADSEVAATQQFKVIIDPTYDSNETERVVTDTLIEQSLDLTYENTPDFIQQIESQLPGLNESAREELIPELQRVEQLYEDTRANIAASQAAQQQAIKNNQVRLGEFEEVKAMLEQLRSEYVSEWNAFQARPKLASIDESIPPIFIHGRNYTETIKVYQGEALEINFRAVHPAHAPRYSFGFDPYFDYGLLRLDNQFGLFQWQTPSNVLGIYDFYVIAEVDEYRTSRIDFQVEVLPNPPLVESLSVSPASVTDKATDPITLTVNNAIHPRLRIDGYHYFQDMDGNGVLDESVDKLLIGSGGASWTGLPYAVPGDTLTFFAKAYSYTFSAQLFSEPVSVTVDVLQTPSLDLDLLEEVSGRSIVGNNPGVLSTQVARYGQNQAAVVRSSSGVTIQRYSNIDSIGIGTPDSSPVSIGTFSTGAIAARADASGNVTIVFVNGSFQNPDASSGSGLWLMRVDANNSVLIPPTRLASIEDSEGFVFTLEMNQNGQGVIAWKGYYVAPVVHLQTFSDGGATLHSVHQLNYAGGFNDGGVWESSAIDADGRYLVAWGGGFGEQGHVATGIVAAPDPPQVSVSEIPAYHAATNSTQWSVLVSGNAMQVIDPSGRKAGAPFATAPSNEFRSVYDIRFLDEQSILLLTRNNDKIERQDYRLDVRSGLSLEAVSVPNIGSLFSAQSIEIDFQIRNDLPTEEAPVDVAFYLSHDDVLTSSDRLLGTVRTSSTLPGESTTSFHGTLTLPPDTDPLWSKGHLSLRLIATIPVAGSQVAIRLPFIAANPPKPNQRTGPANNIVIQPPTDPPAVKYIRPEVVLEQVPTDEFNRSDHFIQLIGYQFISATRQIMRVAPADLIGQIQEMQDEMDKTLDAFIAQDFRLDQQRAEELARAVAVRNAELAKAEAARVASLQSATLSRDQVVAANQAKITAEQNRKAARVAAEQARLNQKIADLQRLASGSNGAVSQINSIISKLGFPLAGLGFEGESLARLSLPKDPISQKLSSSPLVPQVSCNDCVNKVVNGIKDVAQTVIDPLKVQEKISQVQTQLQGVADKIQSQIDRVTAPLKALVQAVQNAHTSIVRSIQNAHNAAVQTATKQYQGLETRINERIEKAIDSAVAEAKEKVVEIRGKLDDLIDSLSSPEGIIEQLKSEAQSIDEQNPFGSVAEIIAKAEESASVAKEVLEQLKEKIAPIIEVIKESEGKFSDWANEKGGVLSDWVKDLGGKISDWGKDAQDIEQVLQYIAGGAEYYWEKIIGAEAVAYSITTSGTLGLGYAGGYYYADINLPGGAKFDTGDLQNNLEGNATLPSVNFVELISGALGGTTSKSSDYYEIRDSLREMFDTPVYFASERLVEWLSAEAQVSAIVTSIYANKDQWVNEAKREGSLEWGRFMAWLSVHNLSLDALIADILKNPNSAPVLFAPLFAAIEPTLGNVFAAQMAGLLASDIQPRGTAMSDGSWVNNELLVRDPFELYTDEALRGLVGLRPQGSNDSVLREAMLELFANPTTTPQSTLETIAQQRGRSLTQIQAEYEKFKRVLVQRDAATGQDEIENLATRHERFAATETQLRYGTVVGAAFGIDPVFGAALNPTGGLVGPGNVAYDSGSNVLSYHGTVHDAAGYLFNYHNAGPGYDYLGLEDDLETSSPLAGQRTGIAYWSQVFDHGYPLRVMFNPGGPVNYHYDFRSSPLLGSNEIGSTDLSHISFGMVYTGRDTVPGIHDPYRSVLTRDGFDLEELADKGTDPLIAKILSNFLSGAFLSGITDVLTGNGLSLEEIESIGWKRTINTAYEQQIFEAFATMFGVTNADILAELPADDVRAPAVVSLMNNQPIYDRVQAYLDQYVHGNAGSATIERLEFDISTYELNVDFAMTHRQSWGDVSDLANQLVTDTDLSWDEIVGRLKALAT